MLFCMCSVPICARAMCLPLLSLYYRLFVVSKAKANSPPTFPCTSKSRAIANSRRARQVEIGNFVHPRSKSRNHVDTAKRPGNSERLGCVQPTCAMLPPGLEPAQLLSHAGIRPHRMMRPDYTCNSSLRIAAGCVGVIDKIGVNSGQRPFCQEVLLYLFCSNPII